MTKLKCFLSNCNRQKVFAPKKNLIESIRSLEYNPVFDSCKRIKLCEPLKTGNSRVFCFLKK